MPLRHCKACARHVRADETTCPFCQTPDDGPRRMFAMGAAIATSGLLAACVFQSVATPVYGAPAPLTSPSPSFAPSASPSQFEPIPPYGVPVPPSASPSNSP